jgi:hypothetical protein
MFTLFPLAPFPLAPPALAFRSIYRYPLPLLLVPQQGMLAWGQKAKVLKSGSVASEGNISSRTHTLVAFRWLNIPSEGTVFDEMEPS